MIGTVEGMKNVREKENAMREFEMKAVVNKIRGLIRLEAERPNLMNLVKGFPEYAEAIAEYRGLLDKAVAEGEAAIKAAEADLGAMMAKADKSRDEAFAIEDYDAAIRELRAAVMAGRDAIKDRVVFS
jgi:hypothetical protein